MIVWLGRVRRSSTEGRALIGPAQGGTRIRQSSRRKHGSSEPVGTKSCEDVPRSLACGTRLRDDCRNPDRWTSCRSAPRRAQDGDRLRIFADSARNLANLCGGNFGGPGRVRTDDLFHAMEARSQLRHRPTSRGKDRVKGWLNSFIVPQRWWIVKPCECWILRMCRKLVCWTRSA